MKYLRPTPVSLAAALVIAATSVCSAVTYTPSPTDMGDLDHHSVYTWRIDNITLDPALINGATLTFTNIRNWDANPNVLHLHLLDTAKNAGVASFIDDPTGAAPVTDMTDDFISPRYHSSSSWLVANGTGDTFLDDHSFTMTPVTWTYTFDAAELAALKSYISNGHNIALGFDPDCHFYNDGISLKLSVPDNGSTLALLAGGILAMGAFHARLRATKRAAIGLRR